MDKVDKLEKALHKYAISGSKQDRIAIDAILHQTRILSDKGEVNKRVYEASYSMGRRY